MRPFLLLLFSFLLLPAAGWPASRLVLPGGTGDFPTIQAAVDASAPGDTVLLGDGTFSGDGNRDVAIGAGGIVVHSTSLSPGSCVLDCEGSVGSPHRGFLVSAAAGDPVTFEAFTIRNGYGANEGGAIRCSNSGIVIRNMALRNNGAGENGGALYVIGSPDARIEDSGIEDNHAKFGGGAWIESSTAEIVSTVFAGNVAPSESDLGGALGMWESTVRLGDVLFDRNEGGYAGGIFSYSTEADLTDCLFKGNRGNFACGGMYSYAGPYHPSYANLLRCEFVGNHGSLAAGGMAISEWSASLEECIFRENTATYAAGVSVNGPADFLRCRFEGNSATLNGGGVYSEISTLEFRECVFSANAANDSGGALFASVNSVYNLYDCTMNGNRSPVGSGIAVIFESEVTLENTIVSFGLLGAGVSWDGSGSADFSCCDIFGNEGGDWVGPIAGQLGVAGNFSADPLYCDDAAEDFTLRADSPCLPGNHPQGENCDVVGAFGEGCGGSTRVEAASWTTVKKMFR
ncbi:MAG: hypothetical protein ABIK65_01865 [Candidatus Eisenbacteria bacterium]